MSQFEINKSTMRFLQLGIMLLFLANVCFLKEESILLYVGSSSIGILFILFVYFKISNAKLRLDSFIKWVTVLYSVYMVYGFFFPNGGFFNWDLYLYTYISNITLYLALKLVLHREDWDLALIVPISVTIIASSLLVIINEMRGASIGFNAARIGSTLSGNVNSVAVYLGILSLVVSYCYSKRKSKLALVILLWCFVFMLLTGSKKAIVLIICDLLIYLKVSKRKAIAFIVFCNVIIVGSLLIMNVSFLYNIIGHRIQDLLYQVFGFGRSSSENLVDMSSAVRLKLVIEAWNIYIKRPLFYLTGGGLNAFAANSHFNNINYYSHCNYTEMLCSFGLVGTVLYYYPLLKKHKQIKCTNLSSNDKVFASVLLLVVFFLSFFMVLFDDICITYFPFIIIFLLAEKGKQQDCSMV